MTVSLISRENQAFINNRKNRVLPRRNEIFANLARKTGWSAFPDTRQRRVFEFILTGLGAGCGLGVGCIILIAATVWFVLALIDWPYLLTANGFTSCGFSIFFAFLVAFFFLMAIVRVPQIRTQMNYPIKLTEVFENLKANGQFIPGKIVHVESHEDIRKITYSFELPDGITMISGDYETTVQKTFGEGGAVMVLYLNSDIHILL